VKPFRQFGHSEPRGQTGRVIIPVRSTRSFRWGPNHTFAGDETFSSGKITRPRRRRSDRPASLVDRDARSCTPSSRTCAYIIFMGCLTRGEFTPSKQTSSRSCLRRRTYNNYCSSCDGTRSLREWPVVNGSFGIFFFFFVFVRPSS